MYASPLDVDLDLCLLTRIDVHFRLRDRQKIHKRNSNSQTDNYFAKDGNNKNTVKKTNKKTRLEKLT